MPTCNTVDLDFLQSAPVKIVNIVDIQATPEQIFAVFEDEHAWPKWFKGIVDVEWTSPKPYGVGTTRTVSLGALKVWEHFIHWDQNKRFTFYFTKTNLPFVKALAEDYELVAVNENTTRFSYTVAYDPALPLRLLGPFGKAALTRNFKSAAQSLAAFMLNNR